MWKKTVMAYWCHHTGTSLVVLRDPSGKKNPNWVDGFGSETRTWNSRVRNPLALFTNRISIQSIRINSANETHKRTSTKEVTHWPGSNPVTAVRYFDDMQIRLSSRCLLRSTNYHNEHTTVTSLTQLHFFENCFDCLPSQWPSWVCTIGYLHHYPHSAILTTARN